MVFDVLLEKLQEKIVSSARDKHELVLEVEPSATTEVAEELKCAGYDYFSYVTAVDRGEKFEIVYRFCSTTSAQDVILKTFTPRNEAVVGSVTGSYKGADWQEREVYDLMGIEFIGHPNMTRILMPDDWVGHPLRKDYKDERIEARPRLY